MFSKGSRYENARTFEAGPDGETVFRGIRPRDMGPAEGVIEHVVQAGDRLDMLARHYYNNQRLWWRILDANPEIAFGGELRLQEMEGEIILIPKAKE
jgi:nucleoid-associated protein YgaU